MKYLKLYENTEQKVWILTIQDMYIGPGHFTSYEKVFSSKQDAINYLINECNDVQEDIMNSNEFTDEAKERYGNMILDNYEICKEFAYDLCEQYSEIEEHYINIYETTLETNVQIKDEYKIKFDAKKYNL